MTRRPNILLLMPDQHRGDWLGLYGRLPLRTPNIDALAWRGGLFAQAICPSPLCAPSRAAFATGFSYDRCDVKHNGEDLPDCTRTFYADLRDAGYHVATCGKLDLLKMSGSWGADGRHGSGAESKLAHLGFTAGCDNGGKHDAVVAWREGRAEPYTLYLASRGLARTHADDYARRGKAHGGTVTGHAVHYLDTAPTDLPDDAYCDNWIGRGGLDLIDAVPKDRPWFLQVNFCGPHEPMDVTRSMKERWRGVDFPVPANGSGLDAAQHREIRRNYAAMIENVDMWVGRYVGHLAEKGLLDDTLVVYTSDHGEMLGDRGYWEKHVPWHPSVHVPLVVAGAGFGGGFRNDHAVSLIDLAATFRALAGAASPAAADGAPLASGDAVRPAAISGLGMWRLAFDGRYKLVAGYDAARSRKEMTLAPFDKAAPGRLYDLANDPDETRDIAAAEPAIAARLKARIGEGMRA
ncbi:MAG: sulfatase-like hydrolase/transferase [Proteobacteria bacterium]|nr:sulfatase-like hydrolase/transferase [Pseudomonadota bacterium]